MRPSPTDSRAISPPIGWSGLVPDVGVAIKYFAACATSILVDGGGVGWNVSERKTCARGQQLNDVIEMPLVWIRDIDGGTEYVYGGPADCLLHRICPVNCKRHRTAVPGCAEHPGVARRQRPCRTAKAAVVYAGSLQVGVDQPAHSVDGWWLT